MLATCERCGIVRKKSVKPVRLSREEEQRRRHERAIAAQDRGMTAARVDAVRRGAAIDIPAESPAVASLDAVAS